MNTTFNWILNLQTTTSIEGTTTEQHDPEAHAESHWVHLVKLCIVCFKVLFISFFMGLAIWSYKNKSAKLPNRRGIMALLLFKIFILGGLMMLDFTTKYIHAFFLLGIGSCFCTFATLQIVIGDVQTESGASLRRKFRWYSVIMCLLYIAVIILSMTDTFGAYCNHTSVYPLIMQSIPALFIINTMFAIWLKYKDFYLEWSDKETFLLHAESHHTERDLFEKRMSTYMCYQYVVAPIHLITYIIGRLAVGGHTEYLGCYDDGTVWKYHSHLGSAFTFFLIMNCFMQAVMQEKIFYGIPKKLGYFDVKEVHEEAHKVSPSTVIGSVRTDIEADNQYVKANDMA